MENFQLIDKFFNPKSIALIGASRKPFGAASAIITGILRKQFLGDIYLINSSASEGETLYELPLYKHLQECPQVDLVFIIVPSKYVKSVIEDCIECKVTNGVIISSGFKESILYDQSKVELEKEIVDLARSNGLRLIGPNCNGIVHVPSFYAFLGPRVKVPPGSCSYVTRGGTAGGFILIGSSLFGRGLGINKLINLGDACDLSIGDFMTYYNEDEQTKVIGVYSEGIQDGPELLKTLKNNIKKPVIFYKSGQSEAGMRAALSHVGAIAGASTNLIYQGFVSQAGVIPANSIEEMLDLAAALSHSVLPSGKRIGIFTFGGSLGVMMTDAAAKQGLDVAPLERSQIEALNQMLPEYWSHSNPIDVTDGASIYEAQNLLKIFRIILREFDALFIIAPAFENDAIFDYAENELNFSSMYKTFMKQNIKRFSTLIKSIGKPIFVLGEYGEISNMFFQSGIPVFETFERMAKTYAGLYKWKEKR